MDPVVVRALLLVVALSFPWGATASAAGGAGAAERTGRELFVTGCSSCHGPEGRGTNQAPPLLNSGAASAYYYLSTGRMPAANSREQPQRKEPAYSPEQIRLLVDYVASLGTGPDVPDVGPGRVAEGGELYRANCAPCHSAAGIGGALSYGQAAPTIHPSTPRQIAAAIRTGPGQMPVFGRDTISDQDVDDIVAYVRYLQSPANPGGARLGGAGPIPEGAVAWLFGMGLLALATAWIGKRVRSG